MSANHAPNAATAPTRGALAWSWRLWRSVQSARRSGGLGPSGFLALTLAASCAISGAAMPLGPEGWRARIATLAASFAWWLLPVAAAWSGAAGLRSAARSGALDDLSLASPGVEERGLGALCWLQGALAASLAAMLGVALVVAFSLLRAKIHAGSASPMALLAQMVGPMPIAAGAFLAFGVSLAGRDGWTAPPPRFAIAATCAAYWTIYALALPRMFAYPAVFATI